MHVDVPFGHSRPIVPASAPHAQKTLSFEGRRDAGSRTNPPMACWKSGSLPVESISTPQKKLGIPLFTTEALTRSEY